MFENARKYCTWFLIYSQLKLKLEENRNKKIAKIYAYYLISQHCRDHDFLCLKLINYTVLISLRSHNSSNWESTCLFVQRHHESNFSFHHYPKIKGLSGMVEYLAKPWHGRMSTLITSSICIYYTFKWIVIFTHSDWLAQRWIASTFHLLANGENE